MLVLSRHRNEAIIIDPSEALHRLHTLARADKFDTPEYIDLLHELSRPTRLTVVAILGNRIRLGIDAPRVIGVHRLEVHEEIEAERACGGNS